MTSDLRNISEAAGYLRCSISALRNYRRQGVGPKSFLLTGRVVYSQAELDRWVREQAEGDAQ